MAVSDYAIPWEPLNLMPGASFLLGQRKAKADSARADEEMKIQRMNADINLRRVSSEEARNAEDRRLAADALKHKLDVERAAALEHVGQLFHQDPGIARGYGKSYGIDIQEKPQQAPAPAAQPMNALLASVPGQQSAPLIAQEAPPPPDPNAVDAVSGGDLNPPPPHIDPSHMVKLDETDLSPFTINADVPKPGAPQPQAPIAAVPPQPQAPPPPPMNKLYQAVIGSDRYDLSGKPETLGLGPKYDAIYESLGGDKAAKAAVIAMYEKDNHENAADKRLADAIAGRGANAQSHEDFLREMGDKYRLTFEQRKQLAAMMNQGRMAAAGASNSPALPDVIRSVEEGAPLSETAAIAAKNHIPTKAYAPLATAVVRNAAAGERATQKREGMEATDDTGKHIGVYKSPADEKVGNEYVSAYHQVRERLNAFLADIRAQGDRVLSREDIQRRTSLGESVVAALRPWNKLSNTAAGQKMESDIVGALGSPGHGWFWGANANVVQHIADEADSQYHARLNALLRPGGGSTLAPALGGPRQGGASHPSEQPVGATTVKNGKTYRKIGPNNWQPVSP